jgi:acyl carrier protein
MDQQSQETSEVLTHAQGGRHSLLTELDRVELMIAIEDQFAGVEIMDDDVEQIQIVGDLIRHLQNSKQVRS